LLGKKDSRHHRGGGKNQKLESVVHIVGTPAGVAAIKPIKEERNGNRLL
jgi:hypothetical protein